MKQGQGRSLELGCHPALHGSSWVLEHRLRSGDVRSDQRLTVALAGWGAVSQRIRRHEPAPNEGKQTNNAVVAHIQVTAST
jgi:hypothetical protein